MNVTIFFDYSCPYVYRAGLWLAELARQGVPVEADWRYFSLSQINNKEEGWQVWNEPVANPGGWQGQRRMRGLRAFWAAEAARQQGNSAFRRYHVALLRAIHEDGLSLDTNEATIQAAHRAELDLTQWNEQSENPALLQKIREDYEEGSEIGVFGTPTFVFEGADPAYLKLADVPTPGEALGYWTDFHRVVTSPLFVEIKRPQ